MALRELAYQTCVLKRFDEYLTELAKRKQKADKIEARNASETDADLIQPVPDFAAAAGRLCARAARCRNPEPEFRTQRDATASAARCRMRC